MRLSGWEKRHKYRGKDVREAEMMHRNGAKRMGASKDV